MLAASAGGVLLALSVPPWGWWPLAFAGVALWDRALAGRRARSRFGRSFLLGLAWLAPALLWMWDLTSPGYLVAVALFAAYVGVAGLLVPGTSPRPWARWLALPGALVLCETARWSFPFEGVPLATVAMSQAAAPLAQVARVGSAIGVVLVVGIGGVALSAAWDRHWRVAGAAVAVVALAWATAMVAPKGTDVDDLSVAIVQGGGPQGTRAGDTDPDDVFDRHMEASGQVEAPVDLVLWPENVVAVEGPFAASREYRELAALARRLDTTLVVGVTEGIDRERFTNFAVVFDADGDLGDRYDKVLRVPFGEYVPFRSLVERFAGASGLSARDAVVGSAPAVLRTDVGTFGVAISWEVFFTQRVPRGRAGGWGGRAQPHQRLVVLADPGPEPAGGVEPAAGHRDGPLGAPGCAHRVQRGRRSRGHGDRPHRCQRAGGAPRDRHPTGGSHDRHGRRPVAGGGARRGAGDRRLDPGVEVGQEPADRRRSVRSMTRWGGTEVAQ